MSKQLTPKSHHAAIVRYAIAEVASVAETYKAHRKNAIASTETEDEETRQHKADLKKLASELCRKAQYILALAE